MPKCYSEEEKAYIRKRLKEEASKCLIQYGIRRTTVDEIVKRAKIPKGTFYLFYKSKELLLFDVLLEQHDLIEGKLCHAVNSLAPEDYTAEKMTDIIFQFYKMADETPILRMLNSDEIELLARKLPQDVIADHFGHDTSMIERVIAKLPVRPELDMNVLSAAFRAIYLSTLHKDEISSEYYEKALRFLIHGLVVQFFNKPYSH